MELKTGILLVNLGTPASPAVKHVRQYIREFLLDRRVIDIPALQRNLLVRGIIAPFRAPKSAASYQKIWTKEGSPLMVISLQQRDQLRLLLGPAYQVELAMRYQQPSIASALEKFKGQPLSKLKVIPMYPQYASASAGTVHEEVMRLINKWEVMPPIEMLSSFHDHPLMIEAWRQRGEEHHPEEYDHVLFSFHGLPERQLLKADAHGVCLKENCCASIGPKNQYCYSAQCYDTARRIAAALKLPAEKYTVCFQSRLGKTPWRRPFTVDTIEALARKGAKKILVYSPAFVADCLETLFEIRQELAEEFVKWGGEKLTLVESLNTQPQWMECLADLAKR